MPPEIDGLGDYCHRLWLNWPADSPLDKKWRFLILGRAEESQAVWPEVIISQFEPNKDSLLYSLHNQNSDLIILHYVGYGFDIDGKPSWLAAALAQWLDENETRRLAVMFHETWASGKPWEKAFWLKPEQRNCARRLLNLASYVATSNDACLQDLKSLGLNKDIRLIPLGTSFAEQKPIEQKWDQLLIFGKEESRLRAIKNHSRFLKYLLDKHLVNAIVLAGELKQKEDPALIALKEIGGTPKIMSAYNLSNEGELPESVKSCGLSLIYCQSRTLPKSTAFQLALSLGQVPITNDLGEPGEPLQILRHYLSYKPDRIDDFKVHINNQTLLKQIGKNVRELSQSHFSWAKIVDAWQALIQCRN